ERAVHQHQLLFAARLVAEDLRLPLLAADRDKRAGRNTLDQMVLFQPISDEVSNGADLEAVRSREIHQIVEARHGAVFAHDLADHSAGIEAGESGDVYCRLRMTGSHEDSAG